MPTGYTNKIGDGCSFEEFALGCADVGEYEPSISDFHIDQIKKAEAELLVIKAMSIHGAEVAAQEDYDKEMETYEKLIRKAKELRVKYEAMMVKVLTWEIPTPEHQGLKDLMTDQIARSIDGDCDTKYYEDAKDNEVVLAGQEWIDRKVLSLTEDLANSTEEHQKEAKRVADRKDYLDKLRESLKQEG